MSASVLWIDEEVEFLRTYYPTRRATYCAGALNREIRSVQNKAWRLGLTRSSVSSEGQYSTLYSPRQLEALEQIGLAYSRGKTIRFQTASDLRDLVKADRIDEALVSLSVAGRSAA